MGISSILKYPLYFSVHTEEIFYTAVSIFAIKIGWVKDNGESLRLLQFHLQGVIIKDRQFVICRNHVSLAVYSSENWNYMLKYSNKNCPIDRVLCLDVICIHLKRELQ